MGGNWSSNPRLQNRKAYEEQRALVYRRAALGEPCGICGKPIDLEAPQWVTRADGKRIRAPWSLEADHITALAVGGSVYGSEAVQPAHRLCNQRKGKGSRRTALNGSAAVVGAVSRGW